MDEIISKQNRKSAMGFGKIYFWTATINNWQTLLKENQYKDVIINSLRYLSDRGKIDVFAFIIMPNHIHLIWRINELNGKETPQGSFLKNTAHEFRKMREKEGGLKNYAVFKPNKAHEFWQRDSLAIELYTEKVAYQKLDYIHENPLQEHWQLVNNEVDYFYSSAKFYLTGIKDFDFIKDLRDEF
jgi:putative transposase